MSEQKTAEAPSFNGWFTALPEGQQAVLRDDKWMLANAAFDAGRLSPKPDRPMLSDAQIVDIGLRYGDFTRNGRGLVTFDFDEYGLRDFAHACIRADREGHS